MNKITNLKKIVIVFCSLLLSLNIYGQGGTWVWMHGSDLPKPNAIYGQKGVSSPLNQPGMLYEAIEWKDLAGNFWVYGGRLRSLPGTPANAVLWKYEIAINEWTWVHGDTAFGVAPVYGVKGVPSPTNTPGERTFGGTTWTDLNGDLWFFSACTILTVIPDLWRYNIATNQWTWISGESSPSAFGKNGIKGVPSASNYPPPRGESACSWTDSKNNLWLFGGSGPFDNLNDVWKYNISTNEWSWEFGANGGLVYPVYGIIGVESPSNDPGSRCVYSRYFDGGNNLYIFGGTGINGNHSDIWKYNLTSGMWTWVGGPNGLNDNGSYTAYCDDNDINLPANRMESRTSCGNSCGLWIFGGSSNSATELNDLWHYSFKTNSFEWVSGSGSQMLTQNCGTKGVPSSSNYPAGKNGGNAWLDDEGNFWMFGGWQYNTLWKFIPDKECMSCVTEKDTTKINPEKVEEFPVLFIPNVFTPNGDGQNDLFEIVNKGYDEFKLSIYDRWGVKMFQTNENNLFWNGNLSQTGNEASAGTYYYSLDLRENKTKKTHFYRGYLTLIR